MRIQTVLTSFVLTCLFVGLFNPATSNAVVLKDYPTSGQDTTYKKMRPDVLTLVDKKPIYPNYLEYIYSQVTYPAEAIAAKQQGDVIMRFVVNEDGSSQDFYAEQSVSELLDNEVIRVLKTMEWEPCELDKKVVKCYHTVKVKFRLPPPKPVKPAPPTKTSKAKAKKKK